MTAILHLHPRETWRLWLPLVMGMGIGLVFWNTGAVFEAFFGIKSSFVRTPGTASSNPETTGCSGRGCTDASMVAATTGLSLAIYFVAAIAHGTAISGTIAFLIIFLLGYGFIGSSLFRAYPKIAHSFFSKLLIAALRCRGRLVPARRRPPAPVMS
jgi:hypothetical protein